MPRKAESTRERILDAAQLTVLDRGFAATSIDAIQEAAGISRGTFFYHFASKDELATELLTRYAASDRSLTDELMGRAEKLADDPLQQALLFLSLHEELFEGMSGAAGCLFASYLYEAGLFDSGAHNQIAESVSYFRSVLGDKLREALAEHPSAEGADPDELADLAYGAMQGAFILSRVYGSTEVMVKHTRHIRRYIESLFAA